MKKKILSTILCLGLLLTSFIIPAQAATVNSEIYQKPTEVSSAAAYDYQFDKSVPEDLVPFSNTIYSEKRAVYEKNSDKFPPLVLPKKMPTEKEAYDIIIGLMSVFPEGMPLTNDDYYQWHGGIYRGGYGCAGYCFYLSDACFGTAPSYKVLDFTYANIRVGDILRTDDDKHSVTVLEKYDDYIVVTEANYGGTVHWFRTITRSEVLSPSTVYLMSRYPKNGWYKDNGKWYYYKNGEATIGWFYDGKDWYYFDDNGVMLTYKWISYNGKWYFVDSSGAMQTGWTKVNGEWYYMDSSGAMQTGWVKDNGNWYYMNKDGDMRTGWLFGGKNWYYFDNDGAMMTNSWITYNGNSYYLLSNGVMATGTQIINGAQKTFDSNGALIS